MERKSMGIDSEVYGLGYEYGLIINKNLLFVYENPVYFKQKIKCKVLFIQAL